MVQMKFETCVLFFIVVAIFVIVIPTIHANNDEEKLWFERKLEESYNRSWQAYHPNPMKVVSHFNYHVHRALEGKNGTRRELKLKHHGECVAQNPIDRCWRCKSDWAKDRKKLATCAKGFGRQTTGGLNGDYYVVTDNSDNDLVNPKPGTIRFGVLQPKPLWIIFAKDMKIKLKGELIVTSDKTIDGRGFLIQICEGSGITIQFAKNVIIHNIKIHDIIPGSGGMIRDTADHVGIRGVDDGDAINVFASSNIWLDHLSMSFAKDGLIDCIKGSTAITISNCHMAKHDHVFLFGASDSDPNDKVMQITVAFNNFGKHLVQRMPRCRWGFFHVVNNDYTYWEMYAIGGTSNPTIISQGNRYIAPNDLNHKKATFRQAPDGDWRNWIWKSERDLLINGAQFIESGPPFKKMNDKDFIKSKPGTYVRRLVRFAGHLKCVEGQKC